MLAILIIIWMLSICGIVGGLAGTIGAEERHHRACAFIAMLYFIAVSVVVFTHQEAKEQRKAATQPAVVEASQ